MRITLKAHTSLSLPSGAIVTAPQGANVPTLSGEVVEGGGVKLSEAVEALDVPAGTVVEVETVSDALQKLIDDEAASIE
jgi:hypothetical protein